jgi:hypothetical protein
LFQKRFRFSPDRLDSDVGELNPMPHAAFPRRKYGRRRPLDILKPHSMPAAVEIMQGDIERVIHDDDVIKVTYTGTWQAPRFSRK